MFVQFLISFLLLGNCVAYIFHLNGSEYARMPPIFHLDPYEACLHDGNDSGIYCYVDFDLVTDKPSELYTMITEYSKKTEVHFNHTKLSHGICLTKTCKKFYQQDKTKDQVATLEACLNDTMWENYQLKTRVHEKVTCKKLDEKVDVHTADVLVAVLLAIILGFNFVGSLWEACFAKKIKPDNSLISCFSISRNWRKFITPAGEGPDPRLTRLTGIYGIKTLNIILVILFHANMPFVVNCDNPHYFEEAYHQWYYLVMTNGTLIVQTFLVMSGFLLSYNMQIYAEKHKVTWLLVPKVIILRWLRLTPPYLVVLAVTATWLRLFGSGPLWQSLVITEVEDCRRNWWYHPLYITNYNNNSACLLHSWYLAADFQVFCIGVLLCVLTTRWYRKVVLALLFVVALLVPAVLTYIKDLDGTVLASPENSRNFIINDPTFIYTFKHGHTNLASFVIGLTTGLLVYHWQTTGFELHRYLRHRFFFWMTVPVGLGLASSGSVFFRDAPRDSVYVRMLFAAFVKPIWGILLGYFAIGMVFQFEDIYRGVLEWPGWMIPSRLSYCAYLLHFTLIRYLAGTKTTTAHLSLLHSLEISAGCASISFLAAIPLHLLVEAPFLRLAKLLGSNNKVPTSETPEKLNVICTDGEESRRIYSEDIKL